MPIQPDGHITAEHARFINAVEQLEPVDTGDLYPYVRQPGYHGSRDDQYALGRPNDYSIRSADDKAGPSDKTAGFDWVSESARLHDDHTVMYRYGQRIRDAYNRRDPRLAGWREWLTYLDGQLIGFDFVGWYTRIPDPSHGMHHHLSKIRRYTTHWPSYASMLSILAAEPLEIWRAGSSRYLKGDDMANVPQPDWENLDWVTRSVRDGQSPIQGGPVAGAKLWLVEQIRALVAGQAASAQREQDLAAAVSALAAALATGGSSVDAAAIIARIDQRTADVTGRIAHLEAELDAERSALADALRSVDK